MRIAHRAQDRAHATDRFEYSGRSRTSAGNQIGMTANIFSKGRDDQISTMCQRDLMDRSQHCIVNDDNWPLAVRTVEAGHDLPRTLELHHSVCGVRWRFDIKRRNRPLAARRLDGFFHRLAAALAKKADRGHTELRQDLLEEEIGAAIDGAGMDDHRAWSCVGPERGRDCRHPRGEDETRFGPIPDGQPILEHFEVGIVDPAIDQSGLFIRALLPQTVGQLKELLPVLSRSKHESRGVEDWIGDKAAEPPYQKIQSSVDSIFSSPASSERILIIGPSTISICAMF